MKVNIFQSKDGKKFMAVLENGETIAKKGRENLDKFITRVTEYVETEHLEDVEITKVTPDSLKKMLTPALDVMVLNLEGMAEKMVRDELASREKATEKGTEKPAPKSTAKAAPATAADKAEEDANNAIAKAEAAKEAALKAQEEAKALEEKAKAEAKAAAQKAKEAIKAAKAAAKAAREAEREANKKTLPQVQVEAEEAKANINSVYDFIAFNAGEGEGEKLQGHVCSVLVDKRVPAAMYRLRLPDGTYKHKALSAIEKGEMVYNEAATVAHKEKVAQEEKEAAERRAARGSRAKSEAEKAHRKAVREMKRVEAKQAKLDERRAKAQEAIDAALEAAKAENDGELPAWATVGTDSQPTASDNPNEEGTTDDLAS